MAWNVPGRNRSPWGNRPDRGAADLDEALRNLQRRLGGLFGGGGGGNAEGGGGTPGMRGFGAGTVVLVLAAIWAATGLYKVDAAERAFPSASTSEALTFWLGLSRLGYGLQKQRAIPPAPVSTSIVLTPLGAVAPVILASRPSPSASNLTVAPSST